MALTRVESRRGRSPVSVVLTRVESQRRRGLLVVADCAGVALAQVLAWHLPGATRCRPREPEALRRFLWSKAPAKTVESRTNCTIGLTKRQGLSVVAVDGRNNFVAYTS